MADRIITTAPTSEQPSLTSLVSGIVTDLQHLIRQELNLARTEVHQEWEKTKTAAASMAAGAALCLMAGLLLSLMLPLLLNWAVPSIPLWGWFGIVGALLGLAGALLLALGRAKAADVHVIPPQTAETMRENVQWIQNQK